MQSASWRAAFYSKTVESWSSAGAWYNKATGEMAGQEFPRGGTPVKITSTKVCGIADFAFCFRAPVLPGSNSVLFYNSAVPGGPGIVASVADFTKQSTCLFGDTVEVSYLPGATQTGCKNCGAAQELIAGIEAGKWKGALFPRAQESWPSSSFYEGATGELTGSGFPLGGVPIKLHRARAGANAHVTLSLRARLPGAKSILVYKSNEPGGPGVVVGVDDYYVDEPSDIALDYDFSHESYE